MAMGQGEQRALHPFFQRDFGVPAKPLPRTTINDELLGPCESQEVATGQLPSSNNPTAAVRNGSPGFHIEIPVAVLDHDPNTDRRKRRKTTKSTVEEFQETPSRIASELPRDRSNSPVDENLTEPCSTAPEPSTPCTDFEPQAQQPVAELKNGSRGGSPTASSNELGSKRKILKLNPNGKLLSSPVADKFTDRTKEGKGTKRGKSKSQKPGNLRKKLVIIKYSSHGKFSESLGKQIDDIITGKARFVPKSLLKPAAPSATSSTTVPKQPTKPTHPFFLKKSTLKNPSATHLTSPDSTPTQSDQEAQKRAGLLTRPLASSDSPTAFLPPKPPFSFKKQLPKFPELVQPIWPPKGLIHVRNNFDEPSRGTEHSYSSPDIHEIKSKMAAVRVLDKESLFSVMLPPSGDSFGILRLPKRQIVSGRALQKIIVPHLSGSPESSTEDHASLSENSHPAITKLYSSLLSSMSAFDLGEFDSQLWVQKYAPSSGQQVLCGTKEGLMLRDWLKHLMVSTIDTGKGPREDEKRKPEEKSRKRRKKTEKLDGFIVSSGDEASEMGEITGSEDELAGDVTVSSNKRTVIRTGDLTFNLKSGGERSRMSNAILLSGPPGCGKTASVYAVAKELDFEVFEINPGNRRSAKDIVERVGDMTQNHLVHNLGGDQGQRTPVDISQNNDIETAKQNKLMGFFKSSENAKNGPKQKRNADAKETKKKPSGSQKQSLILLEEADLLFEEDKQFWSGVLTVISQSKRPIVITCNDEKLIPLDDISFHAILRYRAPPLPLAVDYLLLVAANEGHVLGRNAVEDLYKGSGNDLRKSLMDLNFWCQMAVGSEKSGLDWMIDRWPKGSDLDSNGDPLRVLSLDTYRQHMGWFSQDVIMSPSLTSHIETQQESFYWWQLSLQDSESLEDAQGSQQQSLDSYASRFELLESLQHQSDLMEARSVLDVLATKCSTDPRLDVIDTSLPPISGKQRLNYVEGYRLLHADPISDYSSLPVQIGGTVEVLITKIYRPKHRPDTEAAQAAKVLTNIPKLKGAVSPQGVELLEALAPIMKADYVFPLPTGRQAPSFENGLKPIVEDLGPYVRSIVAFDIRLEQYRLQLSRLLSRDAKGTKRVRTTRASRAALEGGNKAETRKERWFSPDVNSAHILATGKKEWQDLLVHNGFFTVSSIGEPKGEDYDQAMESSSESGA